jgi:hypothetical protein
MIFWSESCVAHTLSWIDLRVSVFLFSGGGEYWAAAMFRVIRRWEFGSGALAADLRYGMPGGVAGVPGSGGSGSSGK